MVKGEWSLAPAFDVTYAFRPSSEWTAHHQMTINGKNDNFTLDDLLKVAEAIKVKNGKEIIDEKSKQYSRILKTIWKRTSLSQWWKR